MQASWAVSLVNGLYLVLQAESGRRLDAGHAHPVVPVVEAVGERFIYSLF